MLNLQTKINMLRLDKIRIEGFKDPTRIIEFEFTKDQVTVIYGENGCGKSTFLKMLHAIFKKDDIFFQQENIERIQLNFSYAGKKGTANFNITKTLGGTKVIEVMVQPDEFKVYLKDTDEEPEKFEDYLWNTRTLLLGVNRGVTEENFWITYDLKELRKLIIDYKDKNSLIVLQDREVKFISQLLFRINSLTHFSERELKEQTKQEHIWFNILKIEEIGYILKKQFEKSQNEISQKTKTTFYNTLSNAVEIELNNDDYILPNDFWNRLEKNKNEILKTVKKLDKSALKEKLLALLTTGDLSVAKSSKIIRAFLVNILKLSEEELTDIKPVDKLISVYNELLHDKKKLVINKDSIHIKLKNGITHSITELSSGERHLLAFLTMVLTIGNNYDILLIDEPEISLHLKWQRKLLPLLKELSPGTQMIVATHSPSIAESNSNYLVELI